MKKLVYCEMIYNFIKIILVTIAKNVTFLKVFTDHIELKHDFVTKNIKRIIILIVLEYYHVCILNYFIILHVEYVNVKFI